MLEDFVVPAVAERLRSYAFGSHLDMFCDGLLGLGYARATIRHKLWVISGLARWLTKKHLTVFDLDESRVDKFLDARRRRGRSCRGFRLTALGLLDQLRSSDVLPRREPACDDSPVATLLARYGLYLRRERALEEGTIVAYQQVVHAFVAEHFKGNVARPDSLCSADVRDFLLTRAGRAPRRVQFMGTALRSFLRFLFLRGETKTNLAFAIPTVRRWRSSIVPRHLPAQDVERLLRACDRSSATGRRDHAILLLLARLGLRASEILALELGDLHWREGEIVVRGKGLVHDRMPLLPDVGKALALYLQKARPAGSSRRVFLCRRAPHRGFGHPSSVTTIVTRALARAGLAPATRGAHLLRHSLATTMVRRGASLSEIGQVLRHRSPNSTEIYAKVDFDALRDVALPWPAAGGAR